MKSSTLLLFWTISAATAKGPASVTALVGTHAQFYCAGTGNYLVWEVDGTPHYHQNIMNRGVTAVTVLSSGTVQSNLTVPATSVNNGTTVQCVIRLSLYSAQSVVSNYSILTVISGIGPVLNLRFNPTFSAIMWDPPPTAGVLSALIYHLTVTNMNTGVLIINTTTTDTSYLLNSVLFCTFYNVSVTAFSLDHKGNTVITIDKTPGEHYKILNTSINVFVNHDHDVIGTIRTVFNIRLQLTGLPCPNQKIDIQAHPQSNKTEISNHIQSLINGDIVYHITAIFRRKLLYTAIISILGNGGIVQVWKQNFSTYHVQHCDVHTDHTSYIHVECTLAINSTAPGFVLIQDEQGQYTINTTLQRHEGDVSKGSVNFTDLPAGEYRVTVYDEMKDYFNNYSPACTYYDLPQIVPLINFGPIITSTLSSMYSRVYGKDINTLLTTTPIERSSAATPLPSVVHSSVQFIALLSSVLTGLLLVLCTVTFVLICAAVTLQRKHKKEPNVTDHIPVEDNPVYITLKTIHLKQNSAYEMTSPIF